MDEASFAPVTARRYSFVFDTDATGMGSLGTPAEGVDAASMIAAMSAFARGALHIAELRLSGDVRIDQFETKARFSVARDYYALGEPADDAAGILPGQVIDLTAKLKADGTLDWTPPPLPNGGKWRVIRLGWSLLGTTNHPATAEATGLEVDKADGAAVRRYIDHYLGMYRDATGPGLTGAHGVRALLTDSIEVCAANWTPGMVEQFKRLRGFDPTPWLPALVGVLIGSRAGRVGGFGRSGDQVLLGTGDLPQILHAAQGRETRPSAVARSGIGARTGRSARERHRGRHHLARAVPAFHRRCGQARRKLAGGAGRQFVDQPTLLGE